LKVTDYQNGFAGMLSWEKELERDLSEIFIKPVEKKVDVTSTTTSSSELTQKEKFVDLIIKNRDVRALVDQENKIKMMYSFPDPNTIIITNNERTLQEVTRRLIQNRTVK